MMLKGFVGVAMAAMAGAVYFYGLPALLLVVGLSMGFAFSGVFDAGVRRAVRADTDFVDAVRDDEDEDEAPARSGAARR